MHRQVAKALFNPFSSRPVWFTYVNGLAYIDEFPSAFLNLIMETEYKRNEVYCMLCIEKLETIQYSINFLPISPFYCLFHNKFHLIFNRQAILTQVISLSILHENERFRALRLSRKGSEIWQAQKTIIPKHLARLRWSRVSVLAFKYQSSRVQTRPKPSGFLWGGKSLARLPSEGK
jgi:hypothetical protein